MNGTLCSLLSAGLVFVLASNVFAAEPEPARPDLYGLYAWAGGYVRYADDVHNSGIRWLRLGGWSGDSADEAALLAAKNGIHIAPALSIRGMGHGRTMPLSEALPLWREVVRGNVERYGPGGSLWQENADVAPLPIRYWEIWNEPNIEFLTPPEGMTRAKMYAELLKVAAEEIRAADPGAKIVAFNTAGGTPDSSPPPETVWQRLNYFGWLRFIREVTEMAGVDSFDVYGTHPYTRPLGPEPGGVIEGVRMLRNLAREQGAEGKPIWFTEVGFPTVYPRNQQVRDEQQQAAFLIRLFAVSGAHDVEQVQIMFIEDIIYGPDQSRRTFGFFTAPGEWRPQAEATRVMIRLIPDPRKNVEVLSEEADGVYAYTFRGPDGEPVLMAWNTGEGTVTRSFDWSHDAATTVDYLGETSKIDLREGRLTLELGECPVYVLPKSEPEVRAALAAE